METSKQTINLNSKTVFTFDGVKVGDGAPSSQHPTTSSTTNSTYIFSCLK